MKVIKDNYSKFPRKAYCYDCGSLIELENEQDLTKDVDSLNGNEYFWCCPCCGYVNLIEIELR